MAVPNVVDLLNGAPGRLSFGATNLSTAYPHGGTALGVVRDLILRRVTETPVLFGEEYAEPIDAIQGQREWVVAARLASWDNDALGKVFLNTAVGAVSQSRVVQDPLIANHNTNRSGTLLGATAIKLVFTPDDPDAHPGFIMYKAMVMPDETMEMRFHATEPMELAILFRGIRDSSNRLVAVGKLVDLAI